MMRTGHVPERSDDAKGKTTSFVSFEENRKIVRMGREDWDWLEVWNLWERIGTL
ncbi:hypothetical protein Fmac_016562 [Flemingia macrophylla]|uniref:Uncharacterized protein n=1 Tax=Flemingia macrophylla TaxID=520843 RepID=A0ABD1MHS3_9FABA